MENFLPPLIGGVIIGLAATMMLYFNGKITGISGIVKNVLAPFHMESSWRYTFLLGLVVGGLLMQLISPQFFSYSFKFSYVEAVVAGLFVGFGTLLGSGCTSGHGVCGIPRLSPRSIIATLTFIGAGVVTVFVRSMM